MIRLAAIADGIIVAADDYQDAKMHSDMAHGQEFISDDAKKVIESSNLSAIDINYIFAAVSFGLALVDLKDCYKIIKQMNILDELSKAYLRIFKKPGVKLLNTFTAEEINKLAKLCSKYDKKLFAVICDLPEDKIRLVLKNSNSDKFVLILDNMTDSKITADVVENIADEINSGKKIFKVKDIVGKKANDLVDVPDEYVLQHYVDSNGVTQTSIRRKSSEVGDYLFVDENGYIQNVKNVTKWERGNTVGSTPSKTSKTGKAVIQRMTVEGKIKQLPNGQTLVYSEAKKQWYNIQSCDMSHIEVCVTYWNETGRYKGPLSPEVREWMNNPNNYYLEYYGYNRSEGGKMMEKYLPPLNK